MTKRLFLLLILIVLLTGGVVGCGGSKDKGINSDKDRPRPAETEPGGPR